MPMGPPVWEMNPTGVTLILEVFFLGEGREAFWIWEVLFLWGGGGGAGTLRPSP